MINQMNPSSTFKNYCGYGITMSDFAYGITISDFA